MTDVRKFCEDEFRRLREKTGLGKDFILRFAVSEPEEADAYTIRTTAEGGLIMGSNERSLLLGLYRFFYNIGVRYLAPGREYEWIPNSIDRRTLVQDETLRPALFHRGVCIEGADSEDNILDMIDWLPKLGMNSFFVQFRSPDTFLERWYSHIHNSFLAPEPYDAEAISRRIDRAMQERGLLHHRVGHGWTGAVLQTCAKGWDVESNKVTEEQKKMTALVNGKRGFFHGIPLNTNLCWSCEETAPRFVQEVLQYAKAHPEVDYLHIWLADDCNNHCECEGCKKLSPTDHYIRLLNRIDEALTEEGLAVRIVFLLYLELLWAPQTERLHHPERFVLMFAPISRRFESGIRVAKDLVQSTPHFKLNHISLPTGVEENIAFLRDWQSVFHGDSFAYDYHLGRAHYGDLGYMQIARRLNEDIYQLPSLGLNGMIACQELRAGLPHFLPNYVMGLTLVQPAFSFGDLEDDYFTHAYGRYAAKVMQYMETLSNLCSPDWFNGKGPRMNEDLAVRYERALSLVLKKRASIDAMDSDHPVEKRFLEVLKYHSRFAELYLQTMIARLRGEEPEMARPYEKLSRLIGENEKKFQIFLDVYRIHEVMQNYTGIR